MTDGPKHIFLSHTKQDEPFALKLRDYMAKVLDIDKDLIFCSSDPDAIEGGKRWFNDVIKNLQETKVFVLLITEASINSQWVAFELGYFWDKDKKQNGTKDPENILPVQHPDVKSKSPFNELQSKPLITEHGLNNFFASLCKKYGTTYSADEMSIRELINDANTLTKPSPERSRQRFKHYLKNVEKWIFSPERLSKGNYNQIYVYSDDVVYQIEINLNTAEAYNEDISWLKKVHDQYEAFVSTAYYVKLKILGSTIFTDKFISTNEPNYYFVPEPRLDNDDGSLFWDANDVQFELALICGRFVPHTFDTIFGDKRPNIEDFKSFAERAGIETRNFPGGSDDD